MMVNSTTPDVVKEQAPPKRLTFNNPTQREEHIRAFRRFLPTLLQDALDIDWGRLPSPVMGYLISHLADHLDLIPITFAVGCALHAMKESSLYTSCRCVTGLLQRLRLRYGVSQLEQLGTRDIWDQFVAGRTLAPGEADMLMIYNTFASIHVPAHLEGLKVRDRLVWQLVISTKSWQVLRSRRAVRREE